MFCGCHLSSPWQTSLLMKPDTEKWGAFCPSLVPKHQVKHIICDRAALSKLMFKSFKNNNSVKKQGIYFWGMIREKNCGNHMWRWLSAAVNRCHGTWLTSAAMSSIFSNWGKRSGVWEPFFPCNSDLLIANRIIRPRQGQDTEPRKEDARQSEGLIDCITCPA